MGMQQGAGGFNNMLMQMQQDSRGNTMFVKFNQSSMVANQYLSNTTNASMASIEALTRATVMQVMSQLSVNLIAFSTCWDQKR